MADKVKIQNLDVLFSGEAGEVQALENIISR